MTDIVLRLRESSSFPYGCQGCMDNQRDEAADEIESLRKALRYFVGCSYPVSTDINPRGHDWRGQDALDFALGEANAALRAAHQQKADTP